MWNIYRSFKCSFRDIVITFCQLQPPLSYHFLFLTFFVIFSEFWEFWSFSMLGRSGMLCPMWTARHLNSVASVDLGMAEFAVVKNFFIRNFSKDLGMCWGCFSSIKLLASSECSSLHSSHLPFCNVNTYSLSNCKLSFVIMFMKGREKFYQSEGVRRNWTLKFAVSCGKWKWKVLGKVANWKLEGLLFQFFIEIEIEWVN